MLKELLPIHCIKKENLFAAFWISIFYHLIAKLGLRMFIRGRADQAAATEKKGWWWTPCLGQEGSWHVGEEGLHGGGKDFPLRAMHAPRPPIRPPLPQLRVGRPGRRLVLGTGGVRGGLVWRGGGGAGGRD